MRQIIKSTAKVDGYEFHTEVEINTDGSQPPTREDMRELQRRIDSLAEKIDLLKYMQFPPPTPPTPRRPWITVNETPWNYLFGFVLGVLVTLMLTYNPLRLTEAQFQQHVVADQYLASQYSHFVQENQRLEQQRFMDRLNNDILQSELDAATMTNDALNRENYGLRVALDEHDETIAAERAFSDRLLGQIDTLNQTVNRLSSDRQSNITLPSSLSLNVNINGSLSGAGSLNSTNPASPAGMTIVPWMGSLDSGAVGQLNITEITLIHAPADGQPGLISFQTPSGIGYMYYNNSASLKQNNSNFDVTLPGLYRVSSWNFFNINSPVDQGESTAHGNLAGLWLEPISR